MFAFIVSQYGRLANFVRTVANAQGQYASQPRVRCGSLGVFAAQAVDPV